MYERFTDRARTIMQLANQEAQRFNHEYIGTEHVLLGLVEEGTGVAAQVLTHLGVTLEQARSGLEIHVPDAGFRFENSVQPRARQMIAGICLLFALAVGVFLILTFFGH